MSRAFRGLAPLAAAALTACGASQSAVIEIDPGTRFQTITAWETNAQAGQYEPEIFARYRDTLATLAILDLGLTRVRLEAASGVETDSSVWRGWSIRQPSSPAWRCGRFRIVNDDANPRHIRAAGFDWTEFDLRAANAQLLKRTAERLGKRLEVVLTYVSFLDHCPPERRSWVHRDDAEEYAEFVLAATLRARDRFGLTPDYWEAFLEPDNVPGWTGTRIGHALVATGRRLREAGFTPRFIAPSTTAMANAAPYFDALAAVPGALADVKELSYHRYQANTPELLAGIVERARRHRINTAMLERISADHRVLHQDLTVGQVSSWQQFSLAGIGDDGNGGRYFVATRDGAQVTLAPRAKFLRQYFRYVRPGAVRIGARSSLAAVRAAAFTSGAGTVVVIDAPANRVLDVRGLPAGAYRTTYTTAATSLAPLPEQRVAAGGALRLELPAEGVATIYPASFTGP